jgi:pyruvate/2-oxoglutarate dehydrogenase complex dihydrolipoamide acyltransferase (E2) component
MTAKDRKQLKVFVLLLVILGVTAILSFRTNQNPSASSPPPAPADATSAKTAAPKTAAKPSNSKQAAAASSDARIRLDWMKEDPQAYEVGRNNLFQYRTGKAMGQTGPPGVGRGSGNRQTQNLPPAPDETPVTPPTPAVFTPPQPPPPPPMQFKYDGFLKTQAGLLASLSDNTAHYPNLREGDVLIGRYRIAKVTDAVVEVEDLQIPRRQAFARIQQ